MGHSEVQFIAGSRADVEDSNVWSVIRVTIPVSWFLNKLLFRCFRHSDHTEAIVLWVHTGPPPVLQVSKWYPSWSIGLTLWISCLRAEWHGAAQSQPSCYAIIARFQCKLWDVSSQAPAPFPCRDLRRALVLLGWSLPSS